MATPYVEILGEDDDVGGEDLLGQSLLGNDDLLGAAVDILGARARANRRGERGGRALQAAVAQKQAQGKVLMDDRGFSESGNFVLGFVSAAVVAAAGSANVTSTPQRVFKVVRLVVPGIIADFFTITSISVGIEPQLMSTDAVPASVFSPDAVGVALRGTTAQANQPISIGVTNISGAGVTFRAAIVGPAVF